MARTKKSAASLADSVYEQLKELAITFQIRPGEQIGEIEWAGRLGVSRTPIREALNRLAKEGFLTYTRNHGFHCRSLDAKEVFDLYELRLALETRSVRLAVERATDEELDDLAEFMKQSKAISDAASAEYLSFDEQFHDRLAELSRNREIRSVLSNVNARIRFVRWIDMESGRRAVTQQEHQNIVDALKRRDAEACDALITQHISRRLDQIVDVIREGYARIYMAEQQAIVRPTRSAVEYQ